MAVAGNHGILICLLVAVADLLQGIHRISAARIDSHGQLFFNQYGKMGAVGHEADFLILAQENQVLVYVL